jgi:hypothetical protein
MFMLFLVAHFPLFAEGTEKQQRNLEANPSKFIAQEDGQRKLSSRVI